MPPALLLAARAGARQPTGPGFDLLLLCHVTCVIVGFGSVVVTAVQGGRARALARGPVPLSLRRYYAPGANWVGRVLYGVPLFGFALLADSGGRFGFHDAWVATGLVLWLTVAFVAEGIVWPAERRLQAAMATDPLPASQIRRDGLIILTVAPALAAILLVVTVLMVAQP